jgi:6-phosphogluconolactonase (cycloisomerase 2 family)
MVTVKLAGMVLVLIAASPAVGATQVFIGSKTTNGAFRSYSLSQEGALKLESLASPGRARSWQALHPTLPVIYTVDQLDSSGAGGVSAFSYDPSTGKLSGMDGGAVPVGVGSNPVCVVAVATMLPFQNNTTTRTTRTAAARSAAYFESEPAASTTSTAQTATTAVAAAVYSSGSVALIQIDISTGSLRPTTLTITNHTGKSPCTSPVGAARQSSPHPHGVFTHPVAAGILFVPDLGMDRIYQYVNTCFCAV